MCSFCAIMVILGLILCSLSRTHYFVSASNMFFLLILVIKYLIQIWKTSSTAVVMKLCNHACALVYSNTWQENREQASTFLFSLPPHCSTAWTNTHADTFWIISHRSSLRHTNTIFFSSLSVLLIVWLGVESSHSYIFLQPPSVFLCSLNHSSDGQTSLAWVLTHTLSQVVRFTEWYCCLPEGR